MDEEDQSIKDARCKKLWQVLDTAKEGQLNINGLKKGLREMDHRSLAVIHSIYPSADMQKHSRMQIPCCRMF